MIVNTHGGWRLLDGREDWRLLNALAVGIANAVAVTRGDACEFDTGAGASAMTYLAAVDPLTGPDDVVVWAWTDEPTASRHVARPHVEPVPSVPVGRDGRTGRFVSGRVA
jgi:hypothetical protein